MLNVLKLFLRIRPDPVAFVPVNFASWTFLAATLAVGGTGVAPVKSGVAPDFVV
ncbi:MAG: hypothetical protein ABSE90_02420 [Verrucomicrobiota bacterium]|jgi:hypothetical protein